MRRRLAALGAALLLAVAAGCGVVTSPPQDDGGQVDTGSGATDAGSDIGSGESGEPRRNGAPRVPIAGLPIGGNEFTLVDEAWCGEAFVLPTPPDGVRVTIVEITGIDATVVDRDCPGSSTCGTSTLDDQNNACTVAVRPDSATATEVQVVFDAYLSCDAEAACGDYEGQIGSGATWTLSAPEGWPLPTPTEPETGSGETATDGTDSDGDSHGDSDGDGPVDGDGAGEGESAGASVDGGSP